MGGGKISQKEPEAQGLQLQTSVYGRSLPLQYGRNRIAGNLIWTGNFTPAQFVNVEKVDDFIAGDGFGGAPPGSKQFYYFLSAFTAFCEGPIRSFRQGYREQIRSPFSPYSIGKGNYAFDPAILTTDDKIHLVHSWDIAHADLYAYRGTYAQQAFSQNSVMVLKIDGSRAYINMPAPSLQLSYSRTAYISRPVWGVGSSPQMRNLTVEIEGLFCSYVEYLYGVKGITFVELDEPRDHWFPFQPSPIPVYWTWRGFSHICTGKISTVDGQPGVLSFLNTDPSTHETLDYIYLNKGNIQSVQNFPSGTYGIVRGADPADVIIDFVTHPYRGTAVQMGPHLGNFAPYTYYVGAIDVPVNPSYIEPVAAADAIVELLKITNSEAVFSQGFLKIIPKGDQQIIHRDWYDNRRRMQRNYTPDFMDYSVNPPVVKALFSLDEDDFEEGDTVIEISPPDSEDVVNSVSVEFADAENFYQTRTVDYTDQASVLVYGLREGESVRATMLIDEGTAGIVAALVGQESSALKNKYSFSLPWKFVLIDPMDVLVFSFPDLEIEDKAIRVLTVEENSEGTLAIEAEELLTGHSSSYLYEHEGPQTELPDYNAEPGNVTRPFIFEPPYHLSKGQFSIWIAAAGESPNWGGATLKLSEDDGIEYNAVGTVLPTAGLGYLISDFTEGYTEEIVRGITVYKATDASIDIQLLTPRMELPTFDEYQAVNFNLPFILGNRNRFEILSYEGAELIYTDDDGRNRYRLTNIYRKGFGTEAIQHFLGSSTFAMLGSNVIKIPITKRYANKTLKFKFVSWNTYNAARQVETDVDDFSFRATGKKFAIGAPIPKRLTAEYNDRRGSLELQWKQLDFVANRPGLFVEIRKAPLQVPQKLLDIFPGLDVTDPTSLWTVAARLGYTHEPNFKVQGDGVYLVALRCGDPVDAELSDIEGTPAAYGVPADLVIEGTENVVGENTIVSRQEVPVSDNNYDYEALADADEPALWLQMGDRPLVEPGILEELTDEPFVDAEYKTYGSATIEFRAVKRVFDTLRERTVKFQPTDTSVTGCWMEFPNTDGLLDFPDADWSVLIWCAPETGSAEPALLFGREEGSWIKVDHIAKTITWQSDVDTPVQTAPWNFSEGDFHLIVVAYDYSRQRLFVFDNDKRAALFENVIITKKTGAVYVGARGWLTSGMQSFKGNLYGFSFHHERIRLASIETLVTATRLSADLYHRRLNRLSQVAYARTQEKPEGTMVDRSPIGDGGYLDLNPELPLAVGLVQGAEDEARLVDGTFNRFWGINQRIRNITTEFTMMCLVRLTAVDKEQYLFHWGDYGGGDDAVEFYISAANYLEVTITDQPGTTSLTWDSIGSGIQLEAGKVYHLAATYNYNNVGVRGRIFINGRVVSEEVSGLIIGGTFPYCSSNFIASKTDGTSKLDGILDEPMVFTKELTPNRIREYAEQALQSNVYQNLRLTEEGYVSALPNTEGIFAPNYTLSLSSGPDTVQFSSTFDLVPLPEEQFLLFSTIRLMPEIGRVDPVQHIRGNPILKTSLMDYQTPYYVSEDITVNAAGQYFEDLSGGFTPLPKAGEYFRVIYADNFENRGEFLVTGTETNRIYVDAPNLVNESGSEMTVQWYTGWKELISSGATYGRHFWVGFSLASSGQDLVALLSKFVWYADVPDIVKSATAISDDSTPPYWTAVTYSSAFSDVPKLMGIIQSPDLGDTLEIQNETATGFEFRVATVYGTYVQKSVRFYARGF